MCYRKGMLFAMIFCISLGSVIPIRLAIAQFQAPNPQAIVILEGRIQPIHFAAQMTQTH